MDNKVIAIIVAVLLAPIAVLLKKGLGKDFLINVLLCLFFYFPAMIHAIWIVTKE